MNRSKRSLCLDAKPADGAAVLRGADRRRRTSSCTTTRRAAPARWASTPTTSTRCNGPRRVRRHDRLRRDRADVDALVVRPDARGPRRVRRGDRLHRRGAVAHRARVPRRGRWPARRVRPARRAVGARADRRRRPRRPVPAGDAAGASPASRVLAASTTGIAPARHGNRSGDHAPQGVYRCDGADAWVAVTVQGDAEWRRASSICCATTDAGTARRCRPRGARRRPRRIDAAIGAVDVVARPRSSRRRSCRRSASPPARRSRTATSSSTSTSRPVASSSSGITPTSVAGATPVRRSTSRAHRWRSGRRRCSAQHNRDILASIGYDDEAIDEAPRAGVIADDHPSDGVDTRSDIGVIYALTSLSAQPYGPVRPVRTRPGTGRSCRRAGGSWVVSWRSRPASSGRSRTAPDGADPEGPAHAGPSARRRRRPVRPVGLRRDERQRHRARRRGLRGAFYVYFASKAALLEALVGELGAELATVTERLDGAGPSLDGTRRGLDAYLTFYERHGRVLVELDSVGSGGAALGAVAGSVRRRAGRRRRAAGARPRRRRCRSARRGDGTAVDGRALRVRVARARRGVRPRPCRRHARRALAAGPRAAGTSDDLTAAHRRPHGDGGRRGEGDAERIGEQAQVGGHARFDAPGRARPGRRAGRGTGRGPAGR